MLKLNTVKHKGQTLVELALVLPILLLLVFGIIDFGRMLNKYILVSNASREVARYYSLKSKDIDFSKPETLTALKTLSCNALGVSETSAIAVSTNTITVTAPGSDVFIININTSDFSITTGSGSVVDGKNVNVMISNQFKFITPIGGVIKLLDNTSNFPTESININSSTVMRIE